MKMAKRLIKIRAEGCREKSRYVGWGKKWAARIQPVS